MSAPAPAVTFTLSLIGIYLAVIRICGVASSTNKQVALEDSEHMLSIIHDISTNNIGSLCYHNTYKSIKFHISTNLFKNSQEKTELVRDFLIDSKTFQNYDIGTTILKNLLVSDPTIKVARILTFSPTQTVQVENSLEGNLVISNSSDEYSVDQEPWYIDRFSSMSWRTEKFLSPIFSPGSWTFPYFSCSSRTWLLSYTIPLVNMKNASQLIGLFVVDVNVSGLDINQCEAEESSSDNNSKHQDDGTISTITSFQSTHKCHNTSRCVFQPGHGWVRGGYTCQCKPGYYSATTKNMFNGSLVEVAYYDSYLQGSTTYSMLYVCLPCPPGCETCTDDTPCLAQYSWPVRLILLSVSLFCAISSIVTILLVINYRKIKVFQYSSPTFLSLTLIGCGIMYSEMFVIYPLLTTSLCVMTKWARHMGFCITYTSLLMKTWRVSLTYRVKSAHKLKLTDKQLLQWMIPIILIMAIYLSTWTISDPPSTVDIILEDGTKFYQCQYGWWDHSIALGELVFLLWGIKVCITVRKARTYFDEATQISWSIYNIALVNCAMAAIHVLILPNCGPDMKYFLAFMRTQLSTTTTMILVFGPKFGRILAGTGDDTGDKHKRWQLSSMVGVPINSTNQMDVYQENEELKEELQKLAAKVEFYKIVGMVSTNHHIKHNKIPQFSLITNSKKEPRLATYSPGPSSRMTVGQVQDRSLKYNYSQTLPHRDTSTGGPRTASIHRPVSSGPPAAATLPRSSAQSHQDSHFNHQCHNGIVTSMSAQNHGCKSDIRLRSFSQNFQTLPEKKSECYMMKSDLHDNSDVSSSIIHHDDDNHLYVRHNDDKHHHHYATSDTVTPSSFSSSSESILPPPPHIQKPPG